MATPSKTCTQGRRGEATHRGGRRPLGGQEGRVKGTSVGPPLPLSELHQTSTAGKTQRGCFKPSQAKFTYDM